MKNTILTLTLLIITSAAFTQTVTNIVSSAVDDKIQLEFTITGLKYYQEITGVDVFVSLDGNDNIGPLKKVLMKDSVDIKNGRYTIIWDVLKETEVLHKDYVFDIRLKIENIKKSLFVTLVGNDVTPIGLRVGMLGKTAWYVEVRGSLLAMQKPNYTYGEGGISDYDKAGYYEFTGTGGWQAYSAIVGVTQQVGWNTFIYAGVGYGVENYIMEFNEYSYDQTPSTGTEWAKDDEYSNSGVEIDVGVLLRYKGFVFGAGGTALNFKSFGWTASLGYSF